MINNRADIRDFIVQIEQKFPVNEWKINHIHLWPLIRIKLYFFLISKIERKNKTNVKENKNKPKATLFRKIKVQLKKKLFYLKYKKWFIGLNRKNNVFVGADSHRVDYKNTRFNKFFDVYIESKNLDNDYLYLEYASNSLPKYKNRNVEIFKPFLKSFIKNKRLSKNECNTDGYSDFLYFVTKDERFAEFESTLDEVNLTKIATRLQLKVQFFKKVLNKISPKNVFILCYYSEDIMALTAAANQLKIYTYEMQHGPQSYYHLAYGSWSKIPVNGYSLLPKIFWNWDNQSSKCIEHWAKNTNFHSAEVVGNFWVDYWRNKSNQDIDNEFILYTLQCEPIKLSDLFSNEIINCIRRDTHKWYIRLHPRHLNKIDTIKGILEKNKILNKVNVDEATSLPLPQLLKNAKLHVTNSSGSAIEASYFNVTSIITGEIGLLYYNDLIDSNQAYYVNHSDNLFFLKFNQILKGDL